MEITPMIAAPSPNGTNRERLFLVRRPGPHDTRGLAHDELPNGTSREDLLRQALQKRGDQPDAAKQRRVGEDDEDDERIAKLAHFLRSKGLGEDDIRTACDAVRLGIGESARFGGAVSGSNFGGALHGEVDQSSRDACLEEELGIEPAKSYRNAKMSGDQRLDFETAYGRQDRLQQISEATQLRRRRQSDNSMAMDASRAENFHARFPNSKRIRNAI
jgi:hypothetical protein